MGFDQGYEEFKVGVMLRQAGEEAGVRQARKRISWVHTHWAQVEFV